jgi:hypothetical protein
MRQRKGNGKMRTLRFATLVILVLVSFGLLLFAGNQTLSLSHLSRLESGEPGVVAEMLAEGMARELENYHLRQIETMNISLPAATPYAPAPAHPAAERFYYADVQGNILIKGLSDKNVPDDLGQNCLLFADSMLSWYQLHMLLEAFADEDIRNVYLAGLAPDGHLTYTRFEVIRPGQFMIYPYIICLTSDAAAFYYYRDEEEFASFNNFESFKRVAKMARDSSPVERPFLRLVAAYKVTTGAFYATLNMFRPCGVQPLTMVKTDNRKDILDEVRELSQTPEQEEEKQ